MLPEWHLTHFVNRRKIEQFAALADQWPEYLDRYCHLARECHINIVPGTMLQRQAGSVGNEGKYLNTAFFISDQGDILGSYSKKNLWGTTERKYTTPGTGPNMVIDTSVGRVGLLVCWDLVFPFAFSELLAQEVEMIIIPGHSMFLSLRKRPVFRTGWLTVFLQCADLMDIPICRMSAAWQTACSSSQT